MASFYISRYTITFTFLIFFFKTLTADPIPSFSFKRFDEDSNFESQIGLFGDAKVVNGGSSVQMTRPSVSSAGRVMCNEPIKVAEGNPRKLVSFSTWFSFSMSPGNGDGLAFVMLPIGFPLNVSGGSSFGLSHGLRQSGIRVLAVEFDTSMDAKFGDLNGNHVGIDVGSLVSVRVSNVSSINLVLNGGEKLQSWIDYNAGLRRLEVRLSKLGDRRPVDPLMSYPIDLSKLWKEEEVFVGLSSSSGNSSQTCSVYSWSFKIRCFPSWLHSEPLDPRAFSEKAKPLTAHKGSVCLLRVLGALIFGTGCGAFIVLFAWAICGNRRPVAAEEYAVHPVEFEYKKIKVVVDKVIEDGKK